MALGVDRRRSDLADVEVVEVRGKAVAAVLDTVVVPCEGHSGVKEAILVLGVHRKPESSLESPEEGSFLSVSLAFVSERLSTPQREEEGCLITVLMHERTDGSSCIRWVEKPQHLRASANRNDIC